MTSFLRTCAVLGLICIAQIATAQSDTTNRDSLLADFKPEVLQLIDYLEYNFNLLGSDSVTISDKDVIINNSYAKLFVTEKVQIEDDLDENRVMVTNKSVQAYLKDIHFFFKKVHFDFNVEEVTLEKTARGKDFFKVTLNRSLSGITVLGVPVRNEQLRFIEINLDEANRDLRIASIYTKGLSAEDDMMFWWNELPPAWVDLFGEEVRINDSLTMADLLTLDSTLMVGDTLIIGQDTIRTFNKSVVAGLKRIRSKEELDLSGLKAIRSLEPLAKFSRLKELDISGTGVSDLQPLRSLSTLRHFTIENTTIRKLDALKYCKEMRELHLNGSNVSEIGVVGAMPALNKLYARNTPLLNLAPLRALTELQILDIGSTAIQDLGPLDGNPGLMRLYVDSANVSELAPLASLRKLEVLSISENPIEDLGALAGMPSLRRVFCRGIAMTNRDIFDFALSQPNVTFIFAAEELNKWWTDLPFAWQQVLKKKLGIEAKPSTAELHKMVHFEELDVRGNTNIEDTKGIEALANLRKLDLSNTSIQELGHTRLLTALEEIDVSGTKVQNIDVLTALSSLQRVNFSNTSVSSLEPLAGLADLQEVRLSGTAVKSLGALKGLTKLEKVYADELRIDPAALQEVAKSSGYLLMYRSAKLRAWWDQLPAQWKEVFAAQIVGIENVPSAENLHEIARITTLRVEEKNEIRSLDPLKELIALTDLALSKVPITDLTVVGGIKGLRHLEVSKCLISSADPLTKLSRLESLILRSTSVVDIGSLTALVKLKKLDISGNQIKSIKPLSVLRNLEELDISNSYIKSLKPLIDLPKLKKLICFNTKAAAKSIDQLKAAKPKLAVEFY